MEQRIREILKPWRGELEDTDGATQAILQLMNEVRADERQEVAKLMELGLAELKAKESE